METHQALGRNGMFSLKQLHGCGLITNYDCSAACAHCAYCSTPKWPRDSMTRETAERLFRFLRQAGCDSVHIGGGEPLLRPEALYPVLDAAQEADIAIEYVETNAAWHKSPTQTATVLDALRRRGVDTLLVSMDPFHNEFIPFRQVKGLIHSCHENGMGVFAWKEAFFDELDAMGGETTHPLEEWARRFGNGSIAGLIRQYGLGLKGRALNTFRPYLTQVPLEDILQQASPCRELAGTHHFHLDLYGNFIPQSCQGLSVAFEDIRDGVTRKKYPVFARLYEEGITSLLNHAREEHGFEPATKYAGKCDLCYAIRKHLVLERGLNLPDLQPREHYRFAERSEG
jgi:hypothetical protein